MSALDNYAIEPDFLKKFQIIISHLEIIPYVLEDESFVDLKVDVEYAKRLLEIYQPNLVPICDHLGPEEELKISFILEQIKELL